MLNKLIDEIQRIFPVNRVVALLTALVVAPAVAWAAQHGLELNPAEVVGIVAGVVAMAYKWVDGWQKHEQLEGRRADWEREEARLPVETFAESERLVELDDIGASLDSLSRGVAGGGVQPAAIVAALDEQAGRVARILAEVDNEPPPEPAINTPQEG